MFLSSFPQLKDKISTINNGINADLFNSKDITNVKKIANRFIYTSCSERGLYKLVQLWPSILENLPDAELLISSYNNFPKSDEDIKILEIITKTPSIKHVIDKTIKLHERKFLPMLNEIPNMTSDLSKFGIAFNC